MSEPTSQALPLPLLFLTLPQLCSKVTASPTGHASQHDVSVKKPSEKPTIAFLTPTIHGHANITLAIIRQIRRLYPECIIHAFGDQPLAGRFKSIPGVYHPTGEEDMLQSCVNRANSGSISASFRSPPVQLGRTGAWSMISGLAHIMAPTPQEYLMRYRKILGYIQELKPELLVVDVLYGSLGLDLSTTTGVPYVLLSPTGSLDTAFFHQPRGEAFWKFPMFFTSTIYPVPLTQAAVNIILGIFVVLICILHPARRRLDTARHDAGLTHSILDPPVYHALALICPSLPQLEYPHVPCPRTAFVGPILNPEQPVSSTDYPDLSAFLNGGPTILVNLGTLFRYTAEDVEAVAEALNLAYLRAGSFRVLWKLPRKSNFEGSISRLDKAFEDGSLIRVEEWLEPPSLAILEHPNVSISVHHGGANSVYEATYAGVPQIILAMWYDLYTLASRVETLGHGIFANRGYETMINAQKLADALVCLLQQNDLRGSAMRTKAKELAGGCRQSRGDERAAKIIWQAATGQTLNLSPTGRPVER